MRLRAMMFAAFMTAFAASACGQVNAQTTAFNIGNGTRIDCADPSTDAQPGNAPCFDPTLRTAAP